MFKDLSTYVRVTDKNSVRLEKLRIDSEGILFIVPSQYGGYVTDKLNQDGTIENSIATWEPALKPKCTCCKVHGK